MTPLRLKAQPIAEGIARAGTMEEIVWRDFRWNNGQIWRMWLVDPERFAPDDIESRSIDTVDISRKRQSMLQSKTLTSR